ncbi:hypothetical protein VOLCADRAFT_80441 [Volvox carteri f. nagariensis]|uniref:Integral membrane protein TerC n=1 Tax=Volvox carteri f. nagariensis TaxID=3068 RepID=D8TRB6_VOLCA|nr:uncharacterized protein VOLCADRAFT_80441 [Volvox carteri f. nagariensis]EFJ49967.1 hypothetical protein VOLCADRAFT_80441 [Volvox carteri f. nagariensis]|eukprot:XP_002949032.1 hypothetical protein VOLCADRAFT_80441 [Volvox carteri f. nagariensis]
MPCPLAQPQLSLHRCSVPLRRCSSAYIRVPFSRLSAAVVRCVQRPPQVDDPVQQQRYLSDNRQVEQEKELQYLSTVLPRTESRYEALAAWVGAAVAFGAGIWYVQGAEKAQEYFAGYLLEQSLSVDNLFVFVLVFNFLKTPVEAQSKVLTWGIATAAVLRAVLIVLGVELVREFEPLLLIFAGILLLSSFKLLTASADDDDDDLSENFIYRFCSRFIKVSDTYDGDNFFTVRDGTRMATPLLLTLAVVELSDVVFAVDSIPAVFGVTLDPFIVYTSNVFAILSLRALYSFVATAMGELRFLDKAVAIVLGFIGSKMVLGFADIEIPTDVSLLVVGLVLGAGVGASLALPESKED